MEATGTKSGAGPKQISRQRQRWFRLIAILLPVLLLLLAEGLLRLLGYGHNTSLFVKDPDDSAWYVMNPYASSIYFSDSVNATRGNIERFAVEKAPGTLRIFVLGESTTAGYPYMHNGSFHRWLLYRLLHSYPDKNIEIINISLTAVNSYTVLGFGRQVLDYQPDAVLIYTGHNEYYGALGVGSTSRIGGNRFLIRTVLWLRRYRVTQLIEQITHYFEAARGGIDTRDNLMQRMAQKQEIPYRSADFYAGVRQFQVNLEALCELFRDRRVPIFLSTLVSNEKDQPPFISSMLSAPAVAPGSPAPGEGAPAILPLSSAVSQYRLGDSAYRAGQYRLAKQAYGQAKELDLLRFRAPDTLNSIIRQLCHGYSDWVHLVDARSLFESVAPHGILGNETLLEHVHPNLYGYALLSEAFYRSMTAARLLSPLPAQAMPLDTLLQRMPVTRVDSLNGVYQIMMLKSKWPFHTPIAADFVRGHSLEEQLAGALSVSRITWLDAMDQLFKARLQVHDKKGALQAAEAVMLEHPDNKTYLAFCGRLSFEAGYWSSSIDYFKILYRQDSSTDHAKSLLLGYIKTDQPDQALALIKGRPDLQGGRMPGQWTGLLGEIMILKRVTSGHPEAGHKIAIDYKMLGAPEAAALYEPPQN